MRTYEQFFCTVCKRLAVEEIGSNGRDGWVKLIVADGGTRVGCPDHAAALLVETDGRPNDALEVIAQTLSLAAQAEQGDAQAALQSAVTSVTEAIRFQRERGRP